jgi:hypothetical protein
MPRKLGNPHPATQQPDAPSYAPDARNHFFEPSSFAAVRAEDADAVANLKANLARRGRSLLCIAARHRQGEPGAFGSAPSIRPAANGKFQIA